MALVLSKHLKDQMIQKLIKHAEKQIILYGSGSSDVSKAEYEEAVRILANKNTLEITSQ